MVNREEPELFEGTFPYTTIPRVEFEDGSIPMNIPEEIWITDTTFRDGQQAREPYSSEQMVEIYKLLNKLNSGNGVIRYTEFFLYTKRDREAVEQCLELGYPYPKVTSWIRAKKEDLELVKKVNVGETGILSSLSDYHIFYKFNWDREKTIQNHLSIAEECLKREIIPRCHIEDSTRANVHDVVVPFVQRLMKLSEEYGLPTKVRICDTLGLGVPYPSAMAPRSIPKIMHAVTNLGGLPSKWLEFHGHNDFHMAVSTATSAWLYGCSGNNGTLLGIGERAGNTPIDGLLFQLLQLKPETKVDTKVVTEIAEYYKKIGFKIPEFYPLVGRNFNVTRAGVHADGLVKNPKIYTAFDFETILGKVPKSVIGQYSGTSGISWKVNDLLGLEREYWVRKDNPGVMLIFEAVSNQYENGRVTAFSDAEIERMIQEFLPDYWVRSKGRRMLTGHWGDDYGDDSH